MLLGGVAPCTLNRCPSLDCYLAQTSSAVAAAGRGRRDETDDTYSVA